MTGWWSLGGIAVERHAWKGWAGAYILADTPGVPRYVGRSDRDVQSRLLQHVDAGDYRFFYVEHDRTAVDAFLRECGWYHYYRNQLSNKIHPAIPRGCGSGCPRCSYGH